MREFSVPEVMPDPTPGATMADAVDRNAAEAPDDVVFSRRVGTSWEPVTAAAFRDEVHAVAKGLVAAGIGPGDRIGLMSRTRYEWTVADYAIWSAGAVTVPIYETSSAEQVEWILSDSGAVALVVETGDHEKVYAEISSAVPEVKHVWRIDGGGLDALGTEGAAVTDEALAAARSARGRDDVATIVYTSGTTGRPKGCVLTHLNLLGTARSAAAVLPQLFNAEGSTLLFLPLAHVFGRLIQGACVENRVRMGHTADVKNLVPDLGQFEPTFLLSVPRVFEKVYNTYKQRADAAGKGKIFDKGVAVAMAYSQALDKGRPGLGLRVRHAFFEKVLYGPQLRAPLGGHLQFAVSGGAPLGARLGHFFRGMGITILEGYGLTETTAAGTVNTVDHIRVGSVGRPSPGCTVRIADDGEILMQGRHVFAEYWRNPAATAEAMRDNWFCTGDIGELDEDGFLTITGRKKELIVTAGGKNVAPAVLEDRLRSHPLVSQCVVVGDAKPFIACLVTIDAESLGPWLEAHGRPVDTKVADLVDDPELRREIQQGIDDANKAVSHAEAIKAFTILPEDLSEEAGTMTPSLKVKRAVVIERYTTAINGLYRD
ncbi:MAG TPA: AMP-dependent synthetase/ligase [Mycobacteriales bacterium]